MSNANERKTRLLEKKQQIEAQLRELENKERRQTRKDDTRRKVLVGAERLDKVERGESSYDALLRDMDAFLTRDRDRELFDLTPLPVSDDSEGEEGRSDHGGVETEDTPFQP